MRKTKKIVLSGAAGSGKTSVILELERRGLHVEHEVIRDHTALLLNDKQGVFENPLEALDNPIPFNETLLNLRLNKLLRKQMNRSRFQRQRRLLSLQRRRASVIRLKRNDNSNSTEQKSKHKSKNTKET